MNKQDYTATLTVNTSPQQAFETINDVARWWTGDLEGNTTNLGDEFTVHFGDIHVSTQKLVELVPNKKVVWLVTESRLNFLKQKDEWTGTKISFEIEGENDQTVIRFTHFGLSPEVECYNSCTKGWDHFFKGSLFKLFTEGKGTPGLM